MTTARKTGDRQRPEGNRSGLSLLDRVNRARAVAALKAQGMTWEQVADEVGLSERHCKNLHADFLTWEEPTSDPMAPVRQTLDLCLGAILQMDETIAQAPPGSPAQVGAVRAALEAAKLRLGVMQAAGMLPRDLAAMSAEQQLNQVFGRMAEVLRRHEIPEVVLRELLEVVESMRLGPSRALPPAA